jgi:acyl carrier protein
MADVLDRTQKVLCEIKRLLVEDMELKITVADLPDDCSLLEQGLALDSLLISELLALMEDEFNLQFDERILDVALFDNLSMLAAFVATEYGAPPADHY